MSEITFDADADCWVMRLTREGIFFNRERYPDATPDDFALAIIKILEKQFDVSFHRKEPPYDRNIPISMSQ